MCTLRGRPRTLHVPTWFILRIFLMVGILWCGGCPNMGEGLLIGLWCASVGFSYWTEKSPLKKEVRMVH